MKIPLLTILLLFIITNTFSQQRDSVRREKTLALLMAINYSNHAFVDLGLAQKVNVVGSRHPATAGYFVASEVHFINRPVFGPKVGVWMSGGLALGINLIYYTDFNQDQLAFRPEIGIGFNRYKATYGYNARLTNTAFDRIARNSFGLTYCFELKKLNKATNK